MNRYPDISTRYYFPLKDKIELYPTFIGEKPDIQHHMFQTLVVWQRFKM